MSIQMKLLAASCALIAAGSAHALDIATTTPNATIYLTGSSALAPDVGYSIQNTICAPGTLTAYFDGTATGSTTLASPPSNFIEYLCTGTSAVDSNGNALLSTNAGQPIAIQYRFQGGSYYGTAPVGSAAVGHYAYKGGAEGCPAGIASGTAICTGWTGNNNVVTTDIPDAGVSDEEASLFTLNKSNQPASCTSEGDTVCPSASLSNFTPSSVLVQTMGLVASQPLINALRAAGLAVNSSAGNPTAYLNRNLIAETLSSTGSVVKLHNWSHLSSLITPVTGGAPFAGPAVVICTRTAGSGTLAATQAAFFHTGCQEPVANTGTIVAPTISQTSGNTLPGAGVTGLYVVGNGSSGAVKACMNNAAANGYLAIGILSFDQASNPGSFDFLGIDGVVPSDAATVNGAYWFTVESGFQTSNSLAANKADVVTLLQNTLATTRAGSPPGIEAVKGQTADLATRTMNLTTNGHTCAPAL